ncbi:unnamed protein product, partial [Adineta ricciae]
MKIQRIFTWLYKKVSNYNLFMLEEHEYDADQIQDANILLKYQKYKTRLYVILLTVCLYILFYITLIKSESKTILIEDISYEKLNKLYSEHDKSVLCPCSTIKKSYENFVSNQIEIHPICSSIFIKSDFIDSLYFPNASSYGVWDFRTTAYSQFKVLSSLCNFSKEMILQLEFDIANVDLLTLNYILKD